MRSTRAYTVQFFQVDSHTIGDAQKADELWNLFIDEKARGTPTIAQSLSGYSFELRELVVHAGVVTGCLALLGSDAPHIRDAYGQERQVQTQPGDQFLQKNYFLYFKANRLLVWQFNIAANHVNNFGVMLTSLLGGNHAVVCNVLLDDAFGFDPTTAAIQYVDLRVKAPKTLAQKTHVQQLNPNNWGVDVFDAMSKSHSSSLSLVLHNRQGSSGKLAGWVGDMVEKLWGSEQARRLKVRVADMDEPIDLLAKRIKRRVPVNMIGLYPDPQHMLQQLQAAKDECDVEIARSI